MSGIVYILCTITALASAILLARAAWTGGGRLLFWSATAFAGMALNNILLYIDTMIAPQTDWSLYPNVVALASVAVLLYGLIWDTA
jgi:Family of unknown function (DUF5985)